MIADGDFPDPGQRSDHADSPRVGDGFVRVDARRAGRSTPARTRCRSTAGSASSGDLAGLRAGRRDPRAGAAAAAARRGDAQRGARRPGATATPRSAPTSASLIVRVDPAARRTGEHIGALVLVRDVTDLRRRDRELVTKDATIREIHHRVKNNLQTVAALLRLQARRIDGPDGARPALEEAVRRVGSIAIVHETLSQAVEESVDFDEIADRLRRDGHRRGRAGRTGVRRTPGGLVRRAALRDGDRAGDGADRAAAERRRARLPGRRAAPAGRSWSTADRTRSARLTCHRRRRRARAADGFDLDGVEHLGLSIVRHARGVRARRSAARSGRPRAGRGTRAAVDVPLE